VISARHGWRGRHVLAHTNAHTNGLRRGGARKDSRRTIGPFVALRSPSMRSVVRTAVVWAGLVSPLILVACGGRTFELPAMGTDSGAEPTPEAASDVLLDVIETGTGDEPFTDGDSIWDAGIDSPFDAVDEDAVASLVCPPAASVQAGAPCSVDSGLICRGATRVVDCSGNPLDASCACAIGTWSCKEPLAPPCPPPPSTTCPPPADIMGGKPCMGIKPGLTCRGNPTMCNGATFYDALQCDGAEWTTLASTVCGIDGG
jgi:hypothetical protein